MAERIRSAGAHWSSSDAGRDCGAQRAAAGAHADFSGKAIHFQGSACRHLTTQISGTVFDATKLPLKTSPLARWINIVLSHVKRRICGTYHSIKQSKHARRNLGEAAYRLN